MESQFTYLNAGRGGVEVTRAQRDKWAPWVLENTLRVGGLRVVGAG